MGLPAMCTMAPLVLHHLGITEDPDWKVTQSDRTEDMVYAGLIWSNLGGNK